ncbi:uncharacterized protein LOC134217031 [Armigeres subalbatus]|uniref:uncharacterized protein LOC134217031 n=1 Tax=Armigeres subalbatus TaxID=124917 RepID=UPI002ED5BA0E
MHQLTAIPKLESETIKIFIEQNGFVTGNSDDTSNGTRRTRSALKKVIDNIIVEDLKILTHTKTISIQGCLKEVAAASVKSKKKKVEETKTILEVHTIRAEFHEVIGELTAVQCVDCDKTKAKCSKIYSYLIWLQQKQQKVIQEIENTDENESKKIKRERNSNGVLQPVNFGTKPPKIELPSLPKLKKEAMAPVCPMEMESALKLSLFNLIREYSGNDPHEFLQFCGQRMMEENCGKAQILTVEQADTDLWHELRKGRVTASRMHEASRCTMLNGSLTSKIMGISSGFSFAMKRGTDLEGHVFAVLQKEYPSLRNTGLVLDPEFPWMGASPDGLADDFVLEIKCPYTPNTYACYIDVNKLSKKYFAQIQLQMHMTRKTKALLGVAALDFEKTRNVTKVWIDYDKEYVDKVMEDSFEFWQKGVFPALLRKRKSKK